MGTEADYLIDQHFDRKHGEYGDPLPPVRVNPLVRLWDARADTLEKCSRVVVNNKALSEQLEAMASAYRQCAREFEKPPVELFNELGFEQPNNSITGGR